MATHIQSAGVAVGAEHLTHSRKRQVICNIERLQELDAAIAQNLQIIEGCGAVHRAACGQLHKTSSCIVLASRGNYQVSGQGHRVSALADLPSVSCCGSNATDRNVAVYGTIRDGGSIKARHIRYAGRPRRGHPIHTPVSWVVPKAIASGIRPVLCNSKCITRDEQDKCRCKTNK